jgi:hypothetical protein
MRIIEATRKLTKNLMKYLRRNLMKRGPDFKSRSVQKVRTCLNVMTVFMNDHMINRSKKAFL